MSADAASPQFKRDKLNGDLYNYKAKREDDGDLVYVYDKAKREDDGDLVYVYDEKSKREDDGDLVYVYKH